MKGKRTRRMQVEGLEQRQLMAGDVTVSLSFSRVLTITGDGDDNGVAIATEGGVFKVIGLERGGSATTVNGNHRLSFKNVRNVVVEFGSGDDSLAITNTSLLSNLTVDMGDGDDLVGLGQFDNTRHEEIFGLHYTEHWIDEEIDPLLGPLSVKQNAIIDLGDGDNELRGRATTIGRRQTILSGDDHDKINLEATGIVGRIGYVPGVTTKQDTSISTGEGNDSIRLDRFSTRKLSVFSGGGNDEIELINLALKQDIFVSAGDDQDQIRMTDVVSRRLKVYADDGDDDTYFKNVRPKLASVNDGGDGDNVYHDLGGNLVSRNFRRRNYNTVVS